MGRIKFLIPVFRRCAVSMSSHCKTMTQKEGKHTQKDKLMEIFLWVNKAITKITKLNI